MSDFKENITEALKRCGIDEYVLITGDGAIFNTKEVKVTDDLRYKAGYIQSHYLSKYERVGKN